MNVKNYCHCCLFLPGRAKDLTAPLYYGTDFATDNPKNSEGSQLQQTILNKVKCKMVGLFSFQCHNWNSRVP